MNEMQIETFLAVVQQGGFARAAQSLYISQPAVTYRIRTLEEELGAKLFDCTAFAAVLTPAGEAFLQDAKQLSDMFYQTRRRMLGFSPQRVITLGFPEMMLKDGRAFLKIMDACAQAIGGEDGSLVRFRQLDRAPLHVHQLVRGEVDLIFTDLGIAELQGDAFERRRLFDDQARVCMHRSHPLAGKKALCIGDLADTRVCFCEDETSFVPHMRALLLDGGIRPLEQEFPTLMQMLVHLLKGEDVAVTNQKPVEHAELVYLPLILERPIDVGIAWMKQRVTPRLRQAVHIVSEIPWETLM